MILPEIQPLPDLEALQARLALLDAQRAPRSQAEILHALSVLSMRIITLDADAIMDLSRASTGGQAPAASPMPGAGTS